MSAATQVRGKLSKALINSARVGLMLAALVGLVFPGAVGASGHSCDGNGATKDCIDLRGAKLQVDAVYAQAASDQNWTGQYRVYRVDYSKNNPVLLAKSATTTLPGDGVLHQKLFNNGGAGWHVPDHYYVCAGFFFFYKPDQKWYPIGNGDYGSCVLIYS